MLMLPIFMSDVIIPGGAGALDVGHLDLVCPAAGGDAGRDGERAGGASAASLHVHLKQIASCYFIE